MKHLVYFPHSRASYIVTYIPIINLTPIFTSQTPQCVVCIYRTPGIGYDKKTGHGNPFNYFTYGAACSEVEIDCLTGDHQVNLKLFFTCQVTTLDHYLLEPVSY